MSTTKSKTTADPTTPTAEEIAAAKAAEDAAGDGSAVKVDAEPGAIADPTAEPETAPVDPEPSTRTIAPAVDGLDLLEDRLPWEREDWLPDCKLVRWPRLDEARARHVPLVADLRAALDVGDQAAEDASVAALANLVIDVTPELRAVWPSEGKEAIAEAGAKVTAKSAEPDGSRPIDPVDAGQTPLGSGNPYDIANAKAIAGDEAYRAEVEKLAPARAEFEDDVAALTYSVYTRLEPVIMLRDTTVAVDVRTAEKALEDPPAPRSIEERVANLESAR